MKNSISFLCFVSTKGTNYQNNDADYYTRCHNLFIVRNVDFFRLPIAFSAVLF